MKILILFILLICSFKADAQYDDIRKEINTLIKYETSIDFKSTPGFIVGMIDGDSSYILSFGCRSLEDKSSILKNDVFELGGVTKIYTAMIVTSMVNEKKLSLYSSINDYLAIKNPAFDSCTLFKLLTHTSGLPKFPPGWGRIEKDSQDPYAAFDQKELEDFFRKYKPNSFSKNEYLYSHLNYVLTVWILESISGLNYGELLKKYLPSNILGSIEHIPTVAGFGLNVKEVKPWSSISYHGAIGIKGSLIDLMNICQLFIRDTSIYQTMLKTYPSRIQKNKSWVALGWQALPIPKHRFVFAHTGRTQGHHTFVGIMPDTKTAVVILANSAKGSDVLGLNILNMMNNNWKRKTITKGSIGNGQ